MPALSYARAHVARLVPVVMAVGLVLIAGCSSGQTAGPADPSTAAQVKARLLQHGKTPGFLPYSANSQLSKATPFAPPRGSAGHVCTDLMSPQLFRPAGSVNGGELVSLAIKKQRLYLPQPPMWFEWMDVYPGPEATSIVGALPQLIGRCGHFVFRNNSISLQAHESVAPLRGFGDQALYVSVRLLTAVPGRFFADDWIVIRSDRTLIWIDGQFVRPPANGHDRMTLQLAQDAWHAYQPA